MSMMENYGDYGLAEASALRRRQRGSLANQAAAFQGQKRGKRNLEDISRNYTEGYQPLASSFGQRGLGGAGVKSGIRRSGLSRYAETFQRDLGSETQNIQDDLNNVAMQEADQQAELEDYIAQLRLQKAQQIMATAASLQQYASY